MAEEGIMTAVRDGIAVLPDDAVSLSPAPMLTLQPAPQQAAKRHQPFGGGDPLVGGAARLLSIPLRELYAVLWRVGVIEVRA
jgi:hypothetical protein